MESERRKSKRINIDVTIQVKSVNQNSSADQPTAVDVNVVDISTTGMAFKSDYQFKLGTYYDANITLENKESIQTIIEVTVPNVSMTLFNTAAALSALHRNSSLKSVFIRLLLKMQMRRPSENLYRFHSSRLRSGLFHRIVVRHPLAGVLLFLPVLTPSRQIYRPA